MEPQAYHKLFFNHLNCQLYLPAGHNVCFITVIPNVCWHFGKAVPEKCEYVLPFTDLLVGDNCTSEKKREDGIRIGDLFSFYTISISQQLS